MIYKTLYSFIFAEHQSESTMNPSQKEYVGQKNPVKIDYITSTLHREAKVFQMMRYYIWSHLYIYICNGLRKICDESWAQLHGNVKIVSNIKLGHSSSDNLTDVDEGRIILKIEIN